MSFRQDLENLRSTFVLAYGDGDLNVHDYLQLSAAVCKGLEEILKAIGGDDQVFDEFVSDCESIVQDYIVPIDLTKFKVPMMIEKFIIDPQLVSFVRPGLEMLRPKPSQDVTALGTG